MNLLVSVFISLIFRDAIRVHAKRSKIIYFFVKFFLDSSFRFLAILIFFCFFKMILPSTRLSMLLKKVKNDLALWSIFSSF